MHPLTPSALDILWAASARALSQSELQQRAIDQAHLAQGAGATNYGSALQNYFVPAWRLPPLGWSDWYAHGDELV